MRALLIIGALVSSGGCLKTAAFNCANDTQCGTGGTCEPEGLCSVVSGSCSSGREFDSSAGSKAGTCVGGDTPTDGPGDMAGNEVPIDMPIDTPAGACAGYVALASGGDGDHLYKFVPGLSDWANQNNSQCSPGATLAIPNTAAELAGLNVLSGGVDAWVGVSDQATEATFVDILGNTFVTGCTSNCTSAGGVTITGNKNPDDCAMMTDGTNLDIKSCGEAHAALCECDPP